MKIFAIIDPVIEKEIAYFFYYERENTYYIEINDDISEWDAPFIIDSYIRRKDFVMTHEDSLRFISQRIVPCDRQNIGAVLKDNGLEEYDEAKLFILADGRCAQDDCCIRQIRYAQLPDKIKARREKRIAAAIQVDERSFLISLADGSAAVLELGQEVSDVFESNVLRRLMAYRSKFSEIKVLCCGAELGIEYGPALTYEQAAELSVKLPFDMEVLRTFVLQNLMTTNDLTDSMGCSRQNINDLVMRGKLNPVDINARVQLFDRREYMALQ